MLVSKWASIVVPIPFYCIEYLPFRLNFTSQTPFLLNSVYKETSLTFVFSVYISSSLGDFKEFAEVIDAVKDKGVVVAVASPDDVDNANKERPNFFEIKKAL